jgi:hypothetical protein
MAPTYIATRGRHRQLIVTVGAQPLRTELLRPELLRTEPVRVEPVRAESVPPPPQDPPIYRDLLRAWADRGRALPGRHDPEWVRLAAPQVRPGQFSGSPAPLGGGR